MLRSIFNGHSFKLWLFYSLEYVMCKLHSFAIISQCCCFRPMEEQFDWKNCQSRSKVQQSCDFPSNPTNSPTLGLQTDWKRLPRAQKTIVTLFHFFGKNTAILSINCISTCEFFLQLLKLNPGYQGYDVCMILMNIHNLSNMSCNFDFISQ